MDSLRYWITEMHVDGFRFDLASSLARTLHETDTLSSFFNIIHQDPIISQVKLIAEPWDIDEDGHMVGKFPRAGPNGTTGSVIVYVITGGGRKANWQNSPSGSPVVRICVRAGNEAPPPPST